MFPVHEMIQPRHADKVIAFFSQNPKAVLKRTHFHPNYTEIEGVLADGETLKAYNEHVIMVTKPVRHWFKNLWSNKCDCTH